ncbi:YolD-like family protein [Sediminibacillus albus]|uniref:YolD-like protein n=1 Tax=Sediminibacillus albus TaxID=407036 RepID=A0A1G8X5X9_9BACI|nr:YolD-like family protein [Sediminibacillus albus]SDJ86022.1 YolD-like protein [Sediminibacillus albus]
MIMPEHVEMLNEWYESENFVEKPILSEDQLQEMKQTIQEAVKFKRKIFIFFYDNGKVGLVEGIIKGHGMGKLEVENNDGVDYLAPSEVVDVSIV